jgi:hypothetical protein
VDAGRTAEAQVGADLPHRGRHAVLLLKSDDVFEHALLPGGQIRSHVECPILILKKCVTGTLHAFSAPVEHMRVNHGSGIVTIMHLWIT